MGTDPKKPDWRERLILISPAVVLVLSLLVIALILVGSFDPQPSGELVTDKTLDQVEEASELTRYPTLYSVAIPSTVELKVRQLAGSPMGTYGLVLQWNLSSGMVIRLGGDGFYGVTTWSDGGVVIEDIVEWQTFVHIEPQGQQNAIWLDMREDGFTLRINEEVAAEFSIPNSPDSGSPMLIDFFVDPRLSGQTSSVNFEQLRIWQAD